jgi:hypothetical protein
MQVLLVAKHLQIYTKSARSYKDFARSKHLVLNSSQAHQNPSLTLLWILV